MPTENQSATPNQPAAPQEPAILPKPRPGAYLVESTQKFADYWVQGAKEIEDKEEALMALHQAMLGFKDLAYDLAEKLHFSGYLESTSSERAQIAPNVEDAGFPMGDPHPCDISRAERESLLSDKGGEGTPLTDALICNSKEHDPLGSLLEALTFARQLERELRAERVKNEQKMLKAMEFGAAAEGRARDASSASARGIGVSANEAAVIAAAVQLAPLLEEGWDDQDTPEDQNAGAKACDALVEAVNKMLAAPEYVAGGLTPLERYALEVLDEHRNEITDLDGGWLQDTAEKFGLLVSVPVTERCGEYCRCAEYGDFPQDCLRLKAEFEPKMAEHRASDREAK